MLNRKHSNRRLVRLEMSPNSSMVYLFPMDLLQFEQTGRRLSMSRVPPLDSGTLWPTSNLNGVMMFSHQSTQHLCLKSLSPQYKSQTCSRRAPGIRAFISELRALVSFMWIRATVKRAHDTNIAKSQPDAGYECFAKYSHTVRTLEFFKRGYRLKNSPSRD